MEYKCTVCSEVVGGGMVSYLDHTEQHIIDLVKHDHPDWVEDDGICTRCVEYYRSELKGSIFKDAPCAIRIRKGKSFLGKIKKFFVKDSEKASQKEVSSE